MMGSYNDNKTTDQYAVEKKSVFTFDLKEESEDVTESSKLQVQCTEMISPPGPPCPSKGHGKSKHQSPRKESEKENQGGATETGMEKLYQRRRGSR